MNLFLVANVVPVLEAGGKFVANPTVVSDKMIDEYGRVGQRYVVDRGVD